MTSDPKYVYILEDETNIVQGVFLWEDDADKEAEKLEEKHGGFYYIDKHEVIR